MAYHAWRAFDELKTSELKLYSMLQETRKLQLQLLTHKVRLQGQKAPHAAVNWPAVFFIEVVTIITLHISLFVGGSTIKMWLV
jgi:hypothetical protein